MYKMGLHDEMGLGIWKALMNSIPNDWAFYSMDGVIGTS